MIELYEFTLSGNCHKVRLMLSLLGIPYKNHLLNAADGEHKSPEFLTLNPFGQVPVLKDGDIVLRDSQAILVYLALAYGDETWFPTHPAEAAAISAWLSTAANEVSRGPGALRLHYNFGRDINLAEAELITGRLLIIMNNRLSDYPWLATDNMSIADIAIYPYLALANQGKVDLTAYPHIENWLARIEDLPGFVSMPGIKLHAS